MTSAKASKVGKTYRRVKLKDGRTVEVAVVKIKRDDKKTQAKGKN